MNYQTHYIIDHKIIENCVIPKKTDKQYYAGSIIHLPDVILQTKARLWVQLVVCHLLVVLLTLTQAPALTLGCPAPQEV